MSALKKTATQQSKHRLHVVIVVMVTLTVLMLETPSLSYVVCNSILSLLDSGMAVEECYSTLNVEGSRNGNCGSSPTVFLPCEERSADEAALCIILSLSTHWCNI